MVRERQAEPGCRAAASRRTPRTAAGAVWCLAVGLLVVLLAGAAGCSYSPSEADLAVASPRPGQVLAPAGQTQPVGAGVALVYSHRADVNLKLAWELFGPFDAHKGRRIYHQLVADGLVPPEAVFVPDQADELALLQVHDKDYLASLDDRWMVGEIVGSGYPVWQSLGDHRARIIGGHKTAVGGTVLAAELAAAHGLAIHLGGGFSHAFPDRGGRGCLLADVPVAIRALRRLKLAERVLVINLAACQANGWATCLAGDGDAYLFDIHEQNNYPSVKQPQAGGVAVADNTSDGDYLSLLRSRLPKLLNEFKPQFVFFLAGADVVAGDPAGRSALTPAGLFERDLYVVEQATSRQIPICLVLGVGGGEDAWQLHYRTIRGLLARYGGLRRAARAGPH